MKSLAILCVILLAMAGCTTASPDVVVNKPNEMFPGDNATVNVPERVEINLTGNVPETVHGDFTVGVFVQRHSANSETGIDSQLEQQMRDALNPNIDVSALP